jgi:ABC-type molybdenum transport system ATPase subunit/photorepair protein PhrA
MNQWFIFGLNGVGKSWFLKNKKCEDITKYKWNSEDTFSALDESWESGDKTCAYAFHTLNKYGTKCMGNLDTQ